MGTVWTEPLTEQEVEGAPWSTLYHTTHNHHPAGVSSFVIADGAREIRVGNGINYSAAFIESKCPSVGDFGYKQKIRFDSGGNRDSKVHFWATPNAGNSTTGDIGGPGYTLRISQDSMRFKQGGSDLSPGVSVDATFNTLTFEIEGISATGLLKAWAYSGDTRPPTPAITYTLPTDGGPRTGKFAYGFETNGSTPGLEEYGLYPMTVTDLGAPDLPTGATVLWRNADNTAWERRKLLIRNDANTAWEWA